MLDYLPEDILFKVFDNLDGADVKELGKTCRALRASVNASINDGCVWRRACERDGISKSKSWNGRHWGEAYSYRQYYVTCRKAADVWNRTEFQNLKSYNELVKYLSTSLKLCETKRVQITVPRCINDCKQDNKRRNTWPLSVGQWGKVLESCTM
ncbi:hypothetical protein SARC_08042 [Sphaeroforma arctica JP610]|uniref:F-box domain-containing protein n=1 Tax=Sphaeroforma arctica JP610 TaxID=667725 RepID=A0A0L0FUI1_9EUKA|nr:hypothetical protein SARC_08042 [Sphaeroforma arctica JP610]KNC79568.1 hypothetical protein SARC_08042 [Sphaeroforma arctica JP610]|eukprot:XP_014153470.1 hypothetical protein SARC_08042 [Sphaeroforma arctica JP610]